MFDLPPISTTTSTTASSLRLRCLSNIPPPLSPLNLRFVPCSPATSPAKSLRKVMTEYEFESPTISSPQRYYNDMKSPRSTRYDSFGIPPEAPTPPATAGLDWTWGREGANWSAEFTDSPVVEGYNYIREVHRDQRELEYEIEEVDWCEEGAVSTHASCGYAGRYGISTGISESEELHSEIERDMYMEAAGYDYGFYGDEDNKFGGYVDGQAVDEGYGWDLQLVRVPGVGMRNY